MVTSTDVWWSSHPSSSELSRHAAQRSSRAQAVAERRATRRASRRDSGRDSGRDRRRVPLPRRVRGWRLPRWVLLRPAGR